MSIVYRTPGPWGPASVTEDLTPNQVDSNFWQLVQDVAAKAMQGVGISNIIVVGDQLTFVLTDHTLLGPYTLPTAVLSFKGEWQPNFSYLANDIFTHGGATYIVLMNHTSAATFDPGANDGHGNSFYGLLLQNPAITIPAGGAIGEFLRKSGIADYVSAWETASLNDLSDVVIPNSPAPLNGDVLSYQFGSWRPGIPITALANLTDVHLGTLSINQALIWDGSHWTNGAGGGGGGSLGSLSDVSLSPTYPSSWNFNQQGDVIVWDWDSGAWINRPALPYNYWGSGNRTLAYEDQNTLLDNNASAATTLTLPYSGGAGTIMPEIMNVWLQQSGAGQVTIALADPVNSAWAIPPGRAAKTRALGSVVHIVQAGTDFWELIGDLAYTSVALPTSGSSVNINPLAADTEVYTATPNFSRTYNVTSAPVGKRMTFVFTTNTTTAYTLTFGTNFKSTGTLNTGTVSGKVFTVTFVGDGTNMNEVSRTTAM